MFLTLRHRAVLPWSMLSAARQQPTRFVSTGHFNARAVWKDASLIWRNAPKNGKTVACTVAGTSLAGLGFLLVDGSSDEPRDPHDVKALSRGPFGKLFTGWMYVILSLNLIIIIITAVVLFGELIIVLRAFTFCSSPTWVDISEPLYSAVSRMPILSSITHFFVMRTFFDQFLGGETTDDCTPKIQALRHNRIGTLLGYNIEAELDGSSKDPELIRIQTEHVLESIEAQGKIGRGFCPDTSRTSGDSRSWVRIKVTGLLPHPIALLHGSNAILDARDRKGLDKDVPYPGLPHDGDYNSQRCPGQPSRPPDQTRNLLQSQPSRSPDRN